MPTVGNTAKPTTSAESNGLNTNNQMAQLITMPPGGPWLITALGCWLAGVNQTVTGRLVAWSPAGTFVAMSAPFTIANGGNLGVGNSILHTAAVSIQINGGDSLYVGFWRNPSGTVQNGRYASGSHLHDTAGSSPETLSGFSTDSVGGIGAYVADYQLLNAAPTAPTITTGGLQHNGRTVFYSWQHHDPDGNPQLSAEWELWNTAQTQRLDGPISGLGTAQSLWRTLPAGYNANQEYAYRVRTYDGSLWGPFSGFTIIRPNSPPNVPTINPVPTNTLTPVFTGGGSDPDPGNSLTSVQYEVRRVSDNALMWLSPEAGGAFAGVTYAGTALAYGTQYKVRSRTIDNWGAWSAWSGYTNWTPAQPTGPTLSPNTTASKQNTVTPTLNLTNSNAFTNHEIEIRPQGGAVVQTIPQGTAYAATTNKNVTPAALSWGVTYEWRARVLVGGALSAWSQWALMTINAEPTAPTLSVDAATISPSGERVVNSLTPVLRAVFNDADKVPYGDAPSAASLEVRNNATDALVWSSSSTAEAVTYAGPALSYDTVYKWRKRYTDNAARQGPFSSYQTFKPTRPPAAALSAPANGSVVTESTPPLDWTYSNPGGKAQYSYRVKVFDKGPTGANYTTEQVAHDSGERVSADTVYALPFGILVDGHDYRWEVTVKDTDGLSYTLT